MALTDLARKTLRAPAVAEPTRHTISAVLRTLRRAGPRGERRAMAWLYHPISQHTAAQGREHVTRRGLRLELDLADNLQRTLFLLGTYEPDFLDFLERELQGGDVYLDIGGHIGLDAMVSAQALRARGGGRVIAFEPTPDSADKLRRATVANGLGELVEVAPVALGAELGRLEIRADSAGRAGDAGMRSQFGTGPLICVAAQWTLDAWLADAGVKRADIVKIDVEGSELRVLEGMPDTLARLHPRAVVVEVAPERLLQAGTPRADIDAVLARSGYAPSGEVFLENVVYRPVAERPPAPQPSAPGGAPLSRGLP